jgi:uncharacterized membrane protein YtjA (UPF0391 family)
MSRGREECLSRRSKKETKASGTTAKHLKPFNGIPIARNTPLKAMRKEVVHMLSWALTFLVIGLIAAVLGFSGVAGAATQIAWVLFVVFVVLALVALVTGRGSGSV